MIAFYKRWRMRLKLQRAIVRDRQMRKAPLARSTVRITKLDAGNIQPQF